MNTFLPVLFLIILQAQAAGALNCKSFTIRNASNLQNRAAFTNKYSSLILRTTKQNKEWIKKSFVDRAEGLYIEFTASMLKELNDNIIKDIDLVTALVNFHKEKVFKEISEALKKEGSDSISYSDFKTGRFHVDTSPETYNRVSTIVEEAFLRADEEFKTQLIREGLVRSEDLSSQWFHLGISKDPDLASVAARKAKKENKITRRILSVNEFAELEKDRQKINRSFRALQSSPSSIFAFEETGRLKLKIVEIYRKNKTPQTFIASIRENLGVSVSESVAIKLINLLREADILSPSLIVEERTSVAVDETPFGAFSLDFIGLGSKNLRSTLEGIIESSSPEEMIQKVRQKEQEITEDFADQKMKIHEVVHRYFQEEREDSFIRRSDKEDSPLISFSGDEGIIVPYREITTRDQLNIQRELFNLFGYAQLRMTFVNPNKDLKLQTSLVSTGESIEKALKQRLASRISSESLSQIQFNVFIPNVPNRIKSAYLFLYMPTPLPPDEKAFLKASFPKVVAEMNLNTAEDEDFFTHGVQIYAIVQSESRWR